MSAEISLTSDSSSDEEVTPWLQRVLNAEDGTELNASRDNRYLNYFKNQVPESTFSFPGVKDSEESLEDWDRFLEERLMKLHDSGFSSLTISYLLPNVFDEKRIEEKIEELTCIKVPMCRPKIDAKAKLRQNSKRKREPEESSTADASEKRSKKKPSGPRKVFRLQGKFAQRNNEVSLQSGSLWDDEAMKDTEHVQNELKAVFAERESLIKERDMLFAQLRKVEQQSFPSPSRKHPTPRPRLSAKASFLISSALEPTRSRASRPARQKAGALMPRRSRRKKQKTRAPEATSAAVNRKCKKLGIPKKAVKQKSHRVGKIRTRPNWARKDDEDWTPEGEESKEQMVKKEPDDSKEQDFTKSLTETDQRAQLRQGLRMQLYANVIWHDRSWRGVGIFGNGVRKILVSGPDQHKVAEELRYLCRKHRAEGKDIQNSGDPLNVSFFSETFWASTQKVNTT